jgi:hypothetical protein
LARPERWRAPPSDALVPAYPEYQRAYLGVKLVLCTSTPGTLGTLLRMALLPKKGELSRI